MKLTCHSSVVAFVFSAMFFSTVSVFAEPVQDVNFAALLKFQRYQQPSATLAMLLEDGDDSPLVLKAVVFGDAADSVSSGTVQVPGGGPLIPLMNEPSDPEEWGIEEPWNSPFALDAARPAGIYTFSLVTKNNGTQTVSPNLLAGSYPPIPKVTNFTSLQSIDPSVSTTIQWTPMGGDAFDFILCNVRDPETDSYVFESPGPGQPGALDGSATQITVPSGILDPGRLYELEILSVNTVGAPITTPFITVTGYSRSVQLEIFTNAAPGQSLNSKFVDSRPHYQWNVERDSLISFRFTRPMIPGFIAVDWTGDGILPSQFSYEWRDNNRVLLCKYNGNLPADTNIYWLLNLSGFRDANGFAPSSDYGDPSGFFHTAEDAPPSRPDVNDAYLIKARSFIQTAATPVATGLYGCDVGIGMDAFNRVKQPLMLNISANSTTAQLSPSEWDPEFELETTYADKANFDFHLPNGDFSFVLDTVADGPKNITLSLGSSDDYPAAPTVTNLAPLQNIDPAAPTTISWAPPAGWNQDLSALGTFIEVDIENDQGEEVYYVGPGEGAGLTASEITLPAGTLFPGRNYRVELGFGKVKDWDATYCNATAGFLSVTEFTIKTSGAPLTPTVTLDRIGNGVSLNLSTAEPFRSMVVETSSDLIRWLPKEILWFGDIGSTNQWYDNDAQYLGKRFYRLRDLTPFENQEGWFAGVVDIQGTVYTDSSHTTPVAGAIVGTTLDGQTTVTDAFGKFFLETDTNSGDNLWFTPYGVKVTIGLNTETYTYSWGEHPRGLDLPW